MNMVRLIRFAALVLLISLTSQAQAMRLKVATLSPEGSVWMQKLREGARELAQQTDNRVKIKFYPGGVMGDDKAILRKIRIGQLHGGAVVGGSLSRFYPDNQIYSLPLKFKSFEEVDYVRKVLDQRIVAGLEKAGFVTFGIAEGGFAYVMSKSPIRTCEDMRKQKVWIPDNDSTLLESIKAFGVTPIPLSIADVRAGLQTGLINTVATPPIGAIALQWHTQIKYMMNEPFLYIYGILAIDGKIFKKISPDDQRVFREIMDRVFQDLDRINRQDNIKALETLNKQGIKFVQVAPVDLANWYNDASTVPKRLIENGKLSKDMVDTLEGLLKEYRSKQASTHE